MDISVQISMESLLLLTQPLSSMNPVFRNVKAKYLKSICFWMEWKYSWAAKMYQWPVLIQVGFISKYIFFWWNQFSDRFQTFGWTKQKPYEIYNHKNNCFICIVAMYVFVVFLPISTILSERLRGWGQNSDIGNRFHGIIVMMRCWLVDQYFCRKRVIDSFPYLQK